MLKEGSHIKDFALEDQEAKNFRLSGIVKKFRVIYFYPKDNTPGCTKEACAFRDTHGEIENLDAFDRGIYADTAQSHSRFATKFNLPFALLSDPDHKVIDIFGVWVKKVMYGKEYEGILRSTFILDREGTVIKVFSKVKPEEHANEVISFLKTRNA